MNFLSGFVISSELCRSALKAAAGLSNSLRFEKLLSWRSFFVMSSLVSECVCGCWFLQHALSSANRSTGINYPQMGLSNLNKCVERSRLVSLVVFLSCVCVCGSLHFGTDLSTSIYSFITDLANVNFTWLLTRPDDVFPEDFTFCFSLMSVILKLISEFCLTAC